MDIPSLLLVLPAVLLPLLFFGFILFTLRKAQRSGAFAVLLDHYGEVDPHTLTDKKRLSAARYSMSGSQMQNLHRFFITRNGLYIRTTGLPFTKRPGFVVPWRDVAVAGEIKTFLWLSSGRFRIGPSSDTWELYLPKKAYRKILSHKNGLRR